MDPDELSSWIKMTAYGLFAALGGVMGHAMRVIDSKEKLRLGPAALEGFAAGFVGVLVLMVCSAMNLSEQWTGVIVGVSGWLGARATIKMLETLVYERLGIKRGSSDKDAQP